MCDKADEGRRRLLRLLASGAAVGVGAGVTGCLGGDETEDADGGDDGGTDGTNETDSGDGDGDGDGASTAEPVDFPEDARCPVCDMRPAEFTDWNAQVAHEDGERAYMCSVGCMTAYTAYSEEFAVSETDLAGAWVTSYETGQLIDGFEAHYALETDPERVDDVMNLNPAAFEEREDAVAYVDEVEHLTEEDIVGYDDLDAETARTYRGQLIPGGGGGSS